MLVWQTISSSIPLTIWPWWFRLIDKAAIKTTNFSQKRQKYNMYQYMHNQDWTSSDKINMNEKGWLPGPLPFTCMVWAMAAAVCSQSHNKTHCGHATAMHQVQITMQPATWEQNTKTKSSITHLVVKRSIRTDELTQALKVKHDRIVIMNINNRKA